MIPVQQMNKAQNEQTARPDKYPQGYFKDKPCKECGVVFSPKAPSHQFCSDECCDISNSRNWLKRNYKITLEEYQFMFEKQEGLCAICRKEGFKMSERQRQGIVIDHCHKTGKVRGLLCHNCNRALGLFSDSIQNLTNAISYLSN